MTFDLGVDSYNSVSTGGDGEGLCLAWTSDERHELDLPIEPILMNSLQRQLAEGIPSLYDYLVHDPYGSHCLRNSLAKLADVDLSPDQIVCGPGVSGLLSELSILAKNGLGHFNHAYRDLPNWCKRRNFPTVAARTPEEALKLPWNVFVLENPSFLHTNYDLLQVIELLAYEASLRKGMLIVDESNANYLPWEKSITRQIYRIDSIVVLRGLSKAYGLGALRLGVAISSSNVSKLIRSSVTPLAVSTLSLLLGTAIWSLGDIASSLRTKISQHKRIVIKSMGERGLSDYIEPSSALPYILFPENSSSIPLLESLGIIGKYYYTAGASNNNCYYRLSIPLRDSRLSKFKDLLKSNNIQCDGLVI